MKMLNRVVLGRRRTSAPGVVGISAFSAGFSGGFSVTSAGDETAFTTDFTTEFF